MSVVITEQHLNFEGELWKLVTMKLLCGDRLSPSLGFIYILSKKMVRSSLLCRFPPAVWTSKHQSRKILLDLDEGRVISEQMQLDPRTILRVLRLGNSSRKSATSSGVENKFE